MGYHRTIEDAVIENITCHQGRTEFSLSVRADLENLPSVRDFIQDAARSVCEVDQFAYDLALAVDEVVTNVIIHGYGNKPGRVEINIVAAPPEMEIVIRDQASPFDPTLLEEPDLEQTLEERSIGGLGVYMAKILTDEMVYRRLEDGVNELRLTKRCPQLLHGAES